MKPEIKEENKCPYCKSKNIKYIDRIVTDRYLNHRFVCLDCDKNSNEWHHVVYEKTTGRE
jgi:transposase-like protein